MNKYASLYLKSVEDELHKEALTIGEAANAVAPVLNYFPNKVVEAGRQIGNGANKLLGRIKSGLREGVEQAKLTEIGPMTGVEGFTNFAVGARRGFQNASKPSPVNLHGNPRAEAVRTGLSKETVNTLYPQAPSKTPAPINISNTRPDFSLTNAQGPQLERPAPEPQVNLVRGTPRPQAPAPSRTPAPINISNTRPDFSLTNTQGPQLEKPAPAPTPRFSAPTQAQLNEFRRSTGSNYNPKSWLDRNKMFAFQLGERNWSDNATARSRGQGYAA